MHIFLLERLKAFNKGERNGLDQGKGPAESLSGKPKVHHRPAQRVQGRKQGRLDKGRQNHDGEERGF